MSVRIAPVGPKYLAFVAHDAIMAA